MCSEYRTITDIHANRHKPKTLHSPSLDSRLVLVVNLFQRTISWWVLHRSMIAFRAGDWKLQMTFAIGLNLMLATPTCIHKLHKLLWISPEPLQLGALIRRWSLKWNPLVVTQAPESFRSIKTVGRRTFSLFVELKSLAGRQTRNCGSFEQTENFWKVQRGKTILTQKLKLRDK